LEKLSSPRKYHLQVQTDLEAVHPILSWFEQLYEPQIPKAIWLRCGLALIEGFTNAVRYANKDLPPETPIDLEITISAETIEMRIWDDGSPFDLERKIKEMPVGLENETGGGRGLQLIQKTTDNFSYTPGENRRNCLLMVKRYEAENGSSQRIIADFN
jgi:serine/threonine-protein kinase RsbW